MYQFSSVSQFCPTLRDPQNMYTDTYCVTLKKKRKSVTFSYNIDEQMKKCLS